MAKIDIEAQDAASAEAFAESEKAAQSLDAARKAEPTIQIGSTGLKEYSGYLNEEYLANLRGKEAIRVYTEMATNDATIGALLFAMRMLLRNAKWRVEPAGDTPKDVEAAEFCEGLMDDMSHSWTEFIEEVASMLTYGHSLFEIVYKVRKGPYEDDPAYRSRFTDGRYGIRRLAPRSQDSIMRWIFADDGSLRGIEQLTEKGRKAFIPIERLLLFRTVSYKNNPEGQSVLRTAFKTYVMKNAITDAEGRAALRAAGVVVMRVPLNIMSNDADDEERAAFLQYKQVLNNLSRDRQGGIMLPSNVDPNNKNLLYDFEYKLADGRRATDFTQILERHDRAIATSVLADFIFLGQQSVGSFALSSDKTALFAAALGAFLHSIEEVLNRNLLPRLWQLNNFDMDHMPKFKASDVETPDLTELGHYITALAGAGVPLFPDEELENVLRNAANLPEKPEESEAEPLFLQEQNAAKPTEEDREHELTMQDNQLSAQERLAREKAKATPKKPAAKKPVKKPAAKK